MGKSNSQKLLEFAKAKQPTCNDWTELHNLVFGVGAIFSKLFPTVEDRTAASKTPEFKQIWDMINQLRDNSGEASTGTESTASGKLLLRMPKSLHEALEREAEAEGVSLNQLIIVKLATQLKSCIS